MSIFGNDLPPGCTSRDVDEAAEGDGSLEECENCGAQHPDDEMSCGLCPDCREGL